MAIATTTIEEQELTEFTEHVYEAQKENFVNDLAQRIKKSIDIGMAQCERGESMSFDERNRMSLVVANPVNSVISNKNSFDQIRDALDKAQNVNESLKNLNKQSSEKFSLPFGGGLIGFFQYEIFSEIEPKLADKLLKSDSTLRAPQGSDAEINHTVFHEFSTFAFFDHQEQTILFFDTQIKWLPPT